MPLIRVENLSKHYGGICALDRASLDIEAGEIHALCGENGAGKSTLNKILSGSVSPDSGSVSIAGEAIPASVAAAERLGIAIVQQETTVFPDLDAAANIFLNRESSPFWLDIRAGHREAKSLLQSLGESFPVDVPLAHLSHAQQQMVGISRALALKCQLLILDEPTASLSVRESEALFTAIRKLCSEGVAILYVTHRLDEVFALADRVTVLRDGAHVLTSAVSELDRDSLIAAMVGRPLGMIPESRDALPSPTEKRGQARALPKYPCLEVTASFEGRMRSRAGQK